MPPTYLAPPTLRLATPRGRRGWLRRERLLARVTDALDAAALLIVAPAGYGKTMLMAEWLRDSKLAWAWLSLDAAHSDARLLVLDLARSLAPQFESAARLLARLESGEGPAGSRAAIDQLLRAMDDLDEPVLLVLDDLHLLDGADESLTVVDRVVAVAARGSALRPVLLSRTRPRLPGLPRLLVSGDAEVIEASELAFTRDEAEAYLASAGIDDARAREAIAARAAGWPVALGVLAKMSRRSAVTPSTRAPVDLEQFIANEVAGDLSDVERSILEACSVAEYFDGDLAAEASGRTEASRVLAGLAARTQLLAEVGDELARGGGGPRANGGPWWRMHALLRDHFLARMAAEAPDRLQEFRRRAAVALERRGENAQATVLALAGEDWPLALRLIEEQADALYTRGEWVTLAGWLDALPADVLEGAPRLALLRARVALRRFRPQEALAYLDRLDATALPPEHRLRLLLYRASAQRHARRLDEALASFRVARALVEEQEPEQSPLRVEADLEEGVALGMSGRFEASARLLERAATQAVALGLTRLAADSYQNLGTALQFAGRLAPASEAFRQARRSWEQLGEQEYFLNTLNNEATSQYFLGEVASARRTLLDVRDRASALGLDRLVGLARVGLADIARDAGDLNAAAALYEDALALGRAIDHGGIEAAAAFGLGMVRRERGEIDAARAILEHYLGTSEEQGAAEFASRFRIGLGALLLSEGRAAEAADTLEAVLAGAGRGFHRRQLALLLLATAWFRLGERERALEALAQLHALVEGLGYDQLLVAEARLSRDLLEDPAAQQIGAGYFGRLLERAASPGRAQPAAGPPAIDFCVRALGPPLVTRPGETEDLPWRSERSKELFLFLLEQPRPVSRGAVEEALWPDAPASQLPSLFHSTLHRLRRAMGQGAVSHSREGYGIGALRLRYDVNEFEALLTRADEARDTEARLGVLRQAIALRTGPFAEGIESAWAQARRERLDDRYIGALLTLARHDLAAERYSEAVAHAEAILDVDPLNEEAVRHLIAAHVGAGQPDLAARAYRRLRDLVSNDLGVPLSRATQEALQRALSGKGSQ